MEATKKKYDKKQYQALKKNLDSLKPILQKKVNFLNEYSEIYKINKRSIAKNMKIYNDLFKAIETFEKLDFQNNQFIKLD